MKNLPDEELFSAYLDGELTAAEQAQVEQILARSPAARRLMSELRALSGTLQSLPPCKLQEDLSRQVLCSAERRILTAPAGSAARADFSQPDGFWGRVRRGLRRRRNLIWPLAATAAAVLIYLMGSGLSAPRRPNPGNQPVAVAPPSQDHGSASAPANTPSETANSPGSNASGTDEVLVVQCNVTPEAIEQGLLEKVLEKRQITERRAVEIGQGSNRALEAVLTPAQLEAALADLKAQPKAFLTAKIGPPSGAVSPKAEKSAKPDPRSVAAQPVPPVGIPGVRMPLPPPPEPKPLPKGDAKRRVRFLLHVVPSPSNAASPASK